MIKASKGNSQPRELIPMGSHVARCYSMVHIGTVTWEYQGEIKHTNRIRLTFELPYETKVFKEENGEQPFVISKEYTLSMHEKSNLRKDLESWRGKTFTEQEADDFDVTQLLGVECMVGIIHRTAGNGNVYDNIASVSGLAKGMTCPPQVNPTFEFNYEEGFDADWIENQPDFIKDAIKSTPEYKERIRMEDELQGNTEEMKRKMAQEMQPKAQPIQEDSDGLPF